MALRRWLSARACSPDICIWETPSRRSGRTEQVSFQLIEAEAQLAQRDQGSTDIEDVRWLSVTAHSLGHCPDGQRIVHRAF